MGQHGPTIDSPKLTALGFKTENLSILASQSFHHRFAVKSGAVCDRPMTRLLAEPATERSPGRIGLRVISVVSTSGRPKSSKISLQNGNNGISEREPNETDLAWG